MNDASLAACLFAVDPAGTGGVWLRAPPGPARDSWLALLRGALPAGAPVRRMPAHIADERLLGGLDLAATLASGRRVAQPGLLAECDGGVLLLAMAERLPAGTAARLAATQDAGASRLGLVALDEGAAPDERPPAGLLDRLAFQLDLTATSWREVPPAPFGAAAIAAARAAVGGVRADDAVLEALCAAAMALGIDSVRAPLLALRVACIAAALGGRDAVNAEDAAIAGRLVLAPRATTVPAEGEAAPPDQAPEDSPGDGAGKLADVLLEAAQAAIPADLLAQLRLAPAGPGRARSVGRAGQERRSRQHGRPIGTREGLAGGGRLHVVATLTAAAPWQRLRGGVPGRVAVRRDDFRSIVFRQRTGTTTIFAVDASGSAALQRLAEAKGAVELLLADCYVRRDKVALIAFRGAGAELLLPPTNALARARRNLAGLPGGGGTPLAGGIDAALALADTVARGGQTPIVTLLTDGRANVGRDGIGGRAHGEADAMAAAGRVRAAGFTALLVDISARPNPQARLLADAMGAQYVPLPHADAALLSGAVRRAAAR